MLRVLLLHRQTATYAQTTHNCNGNDINEALKKLEKFSTSPDKTSRQRRDARALVTTLRVPSWRSIDHQRKVSCT